MEIKKLLTLIFLVLLVGCTQQALSKRGAISIANEAVSPITIIGTLIVQDATLDGGTWYVTYKFEDGSGPIIVEVDSITGNATYITMQDEREDINEFMGYFNKGAEIMVGRT